MYRNYHFCTWFCIFYRRFTSVAVLRRICSRSVAWRKTYFVSASYERWNDISKVILHFCTHRYEYCYPPESNSFLLAIFIFKFWTKFSNDIYLWISVSLQSRDRPFFFHKKIKILKILLVNLSKRSLQDHTHGAKALNNCIIYIIDTTYYIHHIKWLTYCLWASLSFSIMSRV